LPMVILFGLTARPLVGFTSALRAGGMLQAMMSWRQASLRHPVGFRSQRCRVARCHTKWCRIGSGGMVPFTFLILQ
jgi:hypothetical protein